MSGNELLGRHDQRRALDDLRDRTLGRPERGWCRAGQRPDIFERGLHPGEQCEQIDRLRDREAVLLELDLAHGPMVAGEPELTRLIELRLNRGHERIDRIRPFSAKRGVAPIHRDEHPLDASHVGKLCAPLGSRHHAVRERLVHVIEAAFADKLGFRRRARGGCPLLGQRRPIAVELAERRIEQRLALDR